MGTATGLSFVAAGLIMAWRDRDREPPKAAGFAALRPAEKMKASDEATERPRSNRDRLGDEGREEEECSASQQIPEIASVNELLAEHAGEAETVAAETEVPEAGEVGADAEQMLFALEAPAQRGDVAGAEGKPARSRKARDRGGEQLLLWPDADEPLE